ncbi:3-deoxy-7-phosphoheptulonate synthase [Verrucomicrobiota bacterium]
MSTDKIHNVNILSQKLLPTPKEIRNKLPANTDIKQTVCNFRSQIINILDRKDPRLLAVVGPCSIHNIDSALEYAQKLKSLQAEIEDTLLVVMRVYFEKPRTSVGWKGFINDPYLDDSFQIDEGLSMARKFLLKLAEMNLPAGTEALDPITPQYTGDLISWTAIGARTTESQTHREIASGLSTPVGFKNGTDGNITVAINALKSAASPHHFLGINETGQCAVFHTGGNRYGHIILRGGEKPNYDATSTTHCEKELQEAGLPENIMIDCSHANSENTPDQQTTVLENCVNQIINGNKSIIGFMIESNLESGKQPIPKDLSLLKPGVSVTDSCVDWPTTEKMLKNADDALRTVIPTR